MKYVLFVLSVLMLAAPARADGPLNPQSGWDQGLQKVGSTDEGSDVYMNLGKFGWTAVGDGSYVVQFWLVYSQPQHIPQGDYSQVMLTTRVWCTDKTYSTDMEPQYYTRDSLVYASPPQQDRDTPLVTKPVQDGKLSGMLYDRICR